MNTTTDIEDRLRVFVAQEAGKCIGRQSGELSAARTRLKQMYLGQGYSVDTERAEHNLSTYVDRSVLEAVEWAKPSLFRVFCNDDIIRFDPRTRNEEQAAKDATVYVNQVIFGKNMFSLIHDVLTDGLYQRVGWCLAHTPKVKRRTVDRYDGVSEQEAMALMAQAQVDNPEDIQVEQTIDAQLGIPLFNLTIHRTVEENEIKIDPLPSEQVIISSDAKSVEDARFVAYWTVKTLSDLRKEGYSQELIDKLPYDEDSRNEMSETRITESLNGDSADERNDGERVREYRIYEAWTEYDIDGDGLDENIKVTYCGEGNAVQILKWEEWNLYRPPLFCTSSVPIPHAAVGLCLADLVSDLQTLKTEITRQYLDGLALGNQAEIAVIDRTGMGEVDYDSLTARGVGAIHRIRGDVAIQPLPVQSNASESLAGLEMAGGIAERRTGVSSRTQSLQADTLQNTATGASIMEEAVNQRIEMIARIYAETFFKPLGRYILHLLQKYQNKRVQVLVKGKFMEFDPSKWDADMDIAVTVGLGSGNRSKLVSIYQGILSIQQNFVAMLGKASPIRLPNIIYTCHKLVEAAGLEAPERFFGTEEDAQKAEQAIMQQPQQPSPEQQKLLLEQQKAQAKMQIDAQKAQTDAQRKAYETQAKIALEKQKLEGQTALKAMEMANEKQMDMFRIARGERGNGVQQLRTPTL